MNHRPSTTGDHTGEGLASHGTAFLGIEARRRVQAILNESGAPGAAVALTVDDEIVFSAGVGSTEHNGSAPVDADARFYVYSITKTFLAVATLRLVERGLIDLDAPVQRYLPSAPITVPITVRQILNHTGGIPDYGALEAYKSAVKRKPGRPWTSDEYYRHSNAGRLQFKPGEDWSYSNVGYMIVRLMLEKVSGDGLDALLRDLIFSPLGLERTSVATSLEDASVLTSGYSADLPGTGALEDITSSYHPGWVAHGVVIATAADVARFFDALFSGELIGARSLAEMLEPVLVPGDHSLFKKPAYGLGLMIDAGVSPAILAGHAGGGPGFSLAAFHREAPEGHRITSVAFANRDVPDLGLRLSLDLLDAGLHLVDSSGAAHE